MKQIFGFCIALALCVFSGIGVYAVDAPPALRWEGTYNKQPFYVTARPGQTTMLDLNLPLGGHFAYNQQQAVTYIQPPESQQVFRVPARLQTNLAEAHFEKVGPGPALAGYPSTQWRLIVNRKLCAEIYASQQAGKDWGVNLSDVTNVMQALTDLHDIHDSLGCLRFAVPAALGRMIGLPLQVRRPERVARCAFGAGEAAHGCGTAAVCAGPDIAAVIGSLKHWAPSGAAKMPSRISLSF